jgi:hypothetical protein
LVGLAGAGFEEAFVAGFAGVAPGTFAAGAGVDADGEPAVPATPALPAAGTVAVVVPGSAAAVDEAGVPPHAASAAAVAAVTTVERTRAPGRLRTLRT